MQRNAFTGGCAALLLLSLELDCGHTKTCRDASRRVGATLGYEGQVVPKASCVPSEGLPCDHWGHVLFVP